MTKEYFLETLKTRIYTRGTQAIDSIVELTELFFSQNVCIPKGATLQIRKTELIEFGGERSYWEDIVTIYDTTKYRIKQSEPIYEWQWLDYEHILEVDGTSRTHVRMLNYGHYHTEEEANNIVCYGNICKLEETKRERK